MAQSWPLQLTDGTVPATGLGDNISEGFGAAGVAQSWPLQLYDGGAAGLGDNLSEGFGVASAAGLVVWYDITGQAGAGGQLPPVLAARTGPRTVLDAAAVPQVVLDGRLHPRTVLTRDP